MGFHWLHFLQERIIFFFLNCMFFVRYCLANTMGTMAIGYNYFETLEIPNYYILIFDFKTVCYKF